MNCLPTQNLPTCGAWTAQSRSLRTCALIVLLLAFIGSCQRAGLPEAREPASQTPRKNQSHNPPIENVWLVIDGIYFTGDGKGILTTFHSEPTMVLEMMPQAVRHGAQRRLTLWDAATGRERWTIYEGPRFGPIACLPDGKHALLSPDNNKGGVEMWDLEKGKKDRFIEMPTKGIVSLVLSPDGRLLLVGDANGLFLWDMEKNKLVRWYHHGPGLAVDTALSPGGRYVMEAVRLWDGKTGELLSEKPRNEGWLGPIAFSPDGRLILAQWEDRKAWKESRARKYYLVLMERKSGKEIRRFDPAFRFSFSADGKYLLGIRGNKLERWEVATGRLLYSVMPNDLEEKTWVRGGRGGPIDACAFSPDGAFALIVVKIGAAVGKEKIDLQLWRASDGKLIRTWQFYELWNPGNDRPLGQRKE